MIAVDRWQLSASFLRRDSAELASLRARVSSWLEENTPKDWRHRIDRIPKSDLRNWHRKVFEAGLAAPHWPKSHGGMGATLLGVVSAAHNLAVDYLKIRSQFGRSLGSFQALQHRAANDTIAVAEARALIHQSAAFSGSGVDGERLARAAFSKVLDSAIQVTSSCIQMFGAIGFTAEHDAGLFLKRVMHIERVIGRVSLYRSCSADSRADAGLASAHRRCRA